MTPRGRNERSSEGEGRVVLMADRGPDGPRIEAALREVGFSIVSCEVVALPERATRIDPVAIVLDVEQPHAGDAIRRMAARSGRADTPLIIAVGPEAPPGDDPHVAWFRRPVPISELVGLVQEAVTAAAVRTEVPSSVGSVPRAADSDALLVSDFPALAGLPEIESILPDLEGRPTSSRHAGALSPEIEALLDSAARRVREAPEADPDPRSSRSRALLPPEMMAAIEDLLLGDEDPPPLPGRLEASAPAGSERFAHESLGDTAGADDESDRQALTSSPAPSGIPAESVAPPEPSSVRPHPSEPPHTSPGDATSIRAQQTEVGQVDRLSAVPPASSRSDTQAGPHSSPLRSAPPSHRPGPPSKTSPPGPMSRAASTERMGERAGEPGRRTEPPPTTYEPHVPYPPSPSAHPPARFAGRRIGPAHGARSTAAARTEIPPSVVGLEEPLTGIGIEAPLVTVESSRDPVVALATAVRSRVTGALVLSDESRLVTRRILLRDGDLVNAASEHADDALIVFLVERGDLSPEVARRRPKLPPTGRHAAAALIAIGILGQDDLWPVLRTHAEWIIGRALRTIPTIATIEAEPPDRLRAEPNVFGGAAGVEIFLEAIRRVVPPEEALARLGGPDATVGEGSRSELLAESALDDVEIDVLRAAPGSSLERIAGHAGRDVLPVLFGLNALGIISIERPSGTPRYQQATASFDPLDADAIRRRVQARRALVNEADYFSLLGVTPNATAYEIKRAFLDLRRTFEPARLLTAATADLTDDVELIVEVLEEAFEVLRDPRRRDRYRRAIEARHP